MKEVELKLLSELMRNSRRSDRELAKAVGVSQPTISRMIRKLEKEGVIKEYTMIPDFNKLGYHILAITFVKMKKEAKSAEVKQLEKTMLHDFGKTLPLEVAMFERGLGLDCTGVIISYHEDYSSYLKLKGKIRDYTLIDFSGCQSFLISLDDKIHYRSLTFSTLAKHIQTLKEKQQNELQVDVDVKPIKKAT
ncbi:MAG: winged helix-turn-helix transcriptional regulator [Candidatus Bathyarchaeia archaeon]